MKVEGKSLIEETIGVTVLTDSTPLSRYNQKKIGIYDWDITPECNFIQFS